MREKTARRFRFWYGIFLSAFTVVIGVLFLAAAADIYFGYDEATRDQIYSRALVGEYLKPLLFPFCVWVAAVICGFVLSVVLPAAASKRKKPSAFRTYSRLRGRIPAQAEGELSESLARVKQTELARIIVWSVSAAVCLAGAVFSAVYLLNSAHFATTEYNQAMLEAAKRVLPCVVIAFACCIGAVVFEHVAAKRTLPYLKQLIASGAKPAAPREYPALTACKTVAFSKWTVLGVRLALLVLALTFIILGILNGGMNAVLIKAINICTECIGLG